MEETGEPVPTWSIKKEAREGNIAKHEGQSSKKDLPDVQEKLLDFDDMLPHIGEFGFYQKVLFSLMFLASFYLVFVYFTQIFITVVPEKHWCRIPELDHLTVDERLNLAIPLVNSDSEQTFKFSRCSRYDVNFTQLLQNGSLDNKPDPNWPVKPCDYGWEFDYSEIPYASITAELEWVCDRAAFPSVAQAIFFCGAILGGLVFGWVADRYGRIPALAGTNVIGFIAGVGTAFVTNFWQFCVCRFLVGMAFDNCFTMMYILVLEYVGPTWRTFVANMSIAIFFTFGACVLPWMAYFINDWRMLAIATSIPMLLAIVAPWTVPESARWLVSQGKITKAIEIMKKFEKINGKTVDEQIYKEFNYSCVQLEKEAAENKSSSILDLFRTPRLRVITILLINIYMCIALVFDGHVRNVGSLGLDFFLTFTVASATELPAAVFVTVLLDRWGRRWLAFGSLILSGVFSLAATAVPVGIYFATLALIGRLMINIAYNIGMQYAAELLPTVIRAQGISFIHLMGYVATIIAPFVVYLANISPALPMLILGAVGIYGGVLCLFLPETLDQELPQTLQDGEAFGKDQHFWAFPCMAKKPIEEEPEKIVTRSPRRMSIVSNPAELRSSMIRRSSRSIGYTPHKILPLDEEKGRANQSYIHE